MAQTGFTPLLVYSSSTATNAPTAGNLLNNATGSELAINIADGKLFYKDSANAVQVIGWKIRPATAGGTGLTSFAVGDLIYADTTTTLAKLADVATGNALISGGVSTAPSWGKIGLTTHVSGTLPVANGGTGLTTLTAGYIPYGNGTSAFNSSSNISFDGTNFLVGTASQLSDKGATISTAGRSSSCTLAIQAANGTGYDANVILECPGVGDGYFWLSRANNQVRISNGVQTNGVSLAFNASSWGSFSDERLKENLIPITDALNKVVSLRSVIGNYKSDTLKKSRPFLIAQDVQKVLPEAVYQNSETDDTLNLSYTDVIPLLVAAIKEQQNLITTLQTQVAALTTKVGI